ncbi:DJ-1/PfpI family protein [Streptomyces sp. E2N166]|uniref:DJ-1/PfpI family protein n=1 Tax=Streptomyces sp. E2N166 TaxID=1851909 RepID=UPI001EE7DF4B|nr:DJ-1/PfpI family protein [Streptomyces sp. E2N166]
MSASPAPAEVLHAGGSASDGAVTVELVTAQGPREVISGTGGLTLRAVGALDLERADMLLVPGASGRVGEPGEVPEEEVGAGAWRQDEFIPVLLGRTLTTELPALLKKAMDDPDITVATVCGGSLVLAMAGLLEGRPATTHHMGFDMLDATGAHAVRARIVDDSDLITSAGVTSGLDLALYLLEREVGPRIAHAMEDLFSHERRGTVWRAQGPTPTTL